MKVIKTRLKVKPVILILSWLFIVLIPTLCVKTGFNLFLKTHFQQNKIRIEPQLYNELQFFSKDLNEKEFLKQRLKDFNQEYGFKTYKTSPGQATLNKFNQLSSDRLKTKLEKVLGFKVLSLWTYNIDTNRVDSTVNKTLAPQLRNPPRTILKRMFSLLNNQQQYDVLKPTIYRPAFFNKVNPAEEKIQKLYGPKFIQFYFSTLHPYRIVPKQLYETLASKTGVTGNLFLYFAKADIVKKFKKFNLGGYLIAFRLKDVRERLITDFATSRSFYPHLNREIKHLKKSIHFPDSYKELGLSKFQLFADRYSLFSILPQTAIVRKIQKGTILPQDFSDFINRTTVMEVSVPLSQLKHPLASHQQLFQLIINLIFLLGTTIFVRLWLFGLNFKTSIAIKVTFAAIFSCLVPISSLFVLNAIYEDYEKTAFTANIKAYLDKKNLLIKQKMEEELGKYQKKTATLASEIVKQRNFQPDHLRSLFQSWIKENSANGIIFQKFDQQAISTSDPKLKNDIKFKQSWILKKIFFNSLIEFLFSSKIIANTPQKFSQVLTSGNNDAETVHHALTTNGRLISIARVSLNSRLSGFFLKRKVSGKVKPLGLLAVDYAVDKILAQTFKTSLRNIQLSENLSNCQIDISILKKRGNNFVLVPKCTSQSLNKKKIMEEIQKSSKVKSKILYSYKQGKHIYYNLINFSNQLPYATYIQATLPRFENDSGLLTTFSSFYPLFLILITLLLSVVFFINPAIALARSLEIISEGNLYHRLNFKTGDEFTALSNQFNRMTKSLIEKEQLEKFVSSEALNEIKKTTESEMQPGGEKVSATIVFSTFKNEYENSLDSNLLIEQLDIFLGIANSICSQNHGVIDKIIGNTIMMVFRGDFNEQSHQKRACNCALEIHQAMEQQNKEFKLKCFSGLSSGLVISGKIGSTSGKLDYTVIGDTVNMAARLKSAAEKHSGSTIIISQQVKQRVKGSFRLTALEPLRIKGKKGLFKTFSIIYY